jgi:hypothetical protein
MHVCSWLCSSSSASVSEQVALAYGYKLVNIRGTSGGAAHHGSLLE